MKQEYILTEDQRKLVENNMSLIPYAINLRYGHEASQDEDLRSIGALGLCKAAAYYDPSVGASFSTYAVKCITMAVHSHFRAQKAKHRSNGMPCASLNYVFRVKDDFGVYDEELLDLIQDEKADTETQALNRVFYEQARPYVPTFAMLEERGLSMREAGKELHLSKQRVHQRMHREFDRARRLLLRSGTIAL